MKKKKNTKNSGLTLVETLVAISIFTISILGMLSVIAKGISDTSYAKQKIIAEYLAQEGIEHVRNMRDTYVLYPGNGTSWNSFKSADIRYPIPPGSDFTGFTRTTSMTAPIPSNSDEVIISSKVEWTQGSGSYNITFSEGLYNWVE